MLSFTIRNKGSCWRNIFQQPENLRDTRVTKAHINILDSRTPVPANAPLFILVRDRWFYNLSVKNRKKQTETTTKTPFFILICNIQARKRNKNFVFVPCQTLKILFKTATTKELVSIAQSNFLSKYKSLGERQTYSPYFSIVLRNISYL